jgi:hypothetical protein
MSLDANAARARWTKMITAALTLAATVACLDGLDRQHPSWGDGDQLVSNNFRPEPASVWLPSIIDRELVYPW